MVVRQPALPLGTLHGAWLVAAKDLRIEARSRAGLHQVLPFGGIVLVLFALALDPDRGLLARVSPGLFWLAVLLCSLLAVSRSVALEAGQATRDALRLSALSGPSIFLGKVGAASVALLALTLVLGTGTVLLYDVPVRGLVVLVAASLPAIVGLASAGILYGALCSGVRSGETLLPILLLPAVTPVLLGATRAFEVAVAGVPGEAWAWVELLLAFAVAYLAGGTAAFGALLEDA